MTTAAAVEARVRKILMDSWDPIGVAGIAAARDEYDQYVKPIAAMIIAGTSVDELSRHLVEIEAERMALKGDQGRAHSAAVKLQALARLKSREDQ
jgi:hypothetical protein